MDAVRIKGILFLILILLFCASSMSFSSRIHVQTSNDYSSIVMNNGSNQNLEIKIINDDTSSKDVTISFSGVKTEFIDGDKSKTFNIAGKSNQSYIIRLEPVEIGDRNLKIDVRNNNLDLNTTKNVPATVIRSPNQGSREVPGINIFNYIIIYLTSTALYFGLL